MDVFAVCLTAWLAMTGWGAAATLQSTATGREKLFWIGLLAFPALGFLAWYVMGPGSKSPFDSERGA
ncbi:hypothetical protein TMPK1_31620 [Rhodospirillales bacterium TMPK1]|uniref:Cardiolipin synthase N-terminal domain-containing protein n=2 Tax=Roseiterribacter gracilis TaxID=2812848 RepID=A0A8S8XI96_9PROT|nr:hypothetical protein TMPK1_31620 [Rhodospirillales bacterium TMPK1]